MNPFTRIVAKLVETRMLMKIAAETQRACGPGTPFPQHTNPERNAERRAKRILGARQFKKLVKAARQAGVML